VHKTYNELNILTATLVWYTVMPVYQIGLHSRVTSNNIGKCRQSATCKNC